MDVLDEIARSLKEGGQSKALAKPKYRALYDAVLRVIEAGAWKPGAQLPSEAEMARRIPVSLGTVQKALRMLSDDGIVIRRHGHGTFVAAPAAREAEIRNFRFLSDDGRRLLPVYPRVLAVQTTRERGPWSNILKGERSLIRISRLISINLEFLTFGEIYLPAKRFRAFLDDDPRALDGVAFTHLLGERFNAPALHISQRVGFAVIPNGACELIGVPPGTLGMRWEQTAYTYRSAPLYYQRVFLPPNDRTLELGDTGFPTGLGVRRQDEAYRTSCNGRHGRQRAR